MKNNMLIMIVIVILVAAGAFFAGMKYQESKRSNVAGQFGEFQRQRAGSFSGTGGGGSRMGFRPVNGEIISSDDKSITVKLTDGSSKIILVSDKTQINKAEKANLIDLKTGEQVAVFGSENTDGSVTAQNIQLNPVMRAENRNQAKPTPTTTL